MKGLYQKFLFGAGRALKSSSKLANCYGKFVVYILSTIFHIQKYSYESLAQAVENYDPNISEQEKKKMIKEVKRAYFKYRCSPKEYFIYDLKNKSKKEIKDYLFDIEKIVLIYLINSRKDLALFNNKYKLYEKLKEYYKRDIIYMEKSDSLGFEEFKTFAQKHNEFIIKPSNLSCGKGIKVYRLANEDLTQENMQTLFNEIRENAPVVIEEYMHNGGNLAEYYNKALNRLRITVFKTKEGEILVSNCYVGFGMPGRDNVNGASGCIEVLLDSETGASVSNGYSYAYSFTEYEKHPYSGMCFKDFKIDKWNEVLDLVHKLSEELPSVKYVGWDLALTTKGWCIIEGNGNASQETYQALKKKSSRSYFMEFYNLT